MMALRVAIDQAAPARAGGARPPALAEADRETLARLRSVARAALIAPPLDLHRACALIADNAATGPDGDAALLLRALDQASAVPMTFHNPAARETSFAEDWLLRLIGALRDGDTASALFLVGRGVVRQHRRAVLFLAQRYACAANPVALQQLC